MRKWLSTQKDTYKNNECIMKNEDIRKQWEEFIEKYSLYFKSDIEKWKENLNKLENYIIENGKLPSNTDKDKDIKLLGSWLSTQKANYKNNDRIMKDEDIRKLWEEFIEKYSEYFKSNIEKWKENLKKLEEYIEKYNKLPSNKSKDKDIKILGEWLSSQKINYKNNECIIKLSEDIRKQWEEFIEKYSEYFKSNIEKWKENLNNLEEYIIENGKLPSSIDKDKNIKILGGWLSHLKEKNNKNNDRIMKDEEIKKLWEEFINKYIYLFKTNKELWIDNLNKLENYIIENGKMPSKRDKDKNIKILGSWLSIQKANYKKNDRIMKDEDIRKQWEEFIEKYKELF